MIRAKREGGGLTARAGLAPRAREREVDRLPVGRGCLDPDGVLRAIGQRAFPGAPLIGVERGQELRRAPA